MSNEATLETGGTGQDAIAFRVHWGLPALLLPNVLLISIPLKLYLPNRLDLEADVLAYVAAFAAAGVLAVIVGLASTPARNRSRLTTMLFFAGVYFLLADALAPTTLPILDGRLDPQPIREPLSYTLIELAIFSLAGAAAWWTPAVRIRLFGSVLVVAFFAADVFDLTLAKLEDAEQAPGYADQEQPDRSELASGPNVYHFVFDGFSSDGFASLVDQVGAREALAGFVWFRQNQTNHTSTQFSFPSFLSGRLIETEGFNRWRLGILKGGSGVFDDALRHGYSISTYANSCQLLPRRCTSESEIELPWQRSLRIAQFFDLWALRVVPNFLQAEIYSEGSGIFSSMVAEFGTGEQPAGGYLIKRRNLALIEQVMRDESGRPDTGQYVFGHFLIPHLPFTLDPKCRQRAKRVDYFDWVNGRPGNYFAQASCALRQILALIDRLKQLDRFEHSAIIIHADHGNLTRCIDTGDRAVPEEINRRIEAVSMNGHDGEQIDCWSRALLLVKRPGAPVSSELEISDRRTQLLDVRATVATMAGMRPVETDGFDAFAEGFPERRRLSLIAGSYQPKRVASGGARQSSEFVHVCQQIQEGELNHFVHAADAAGWSIEPNLRVACR